MTGAGRRRPRFGRRACAWAAVVIAGVTWPGFVARSADGPSATMSPDSGLVDGQAVAVSGSGFGQGQSIVMAECEGSVAQPPTSAAACDGSTGNTDAQADLSGGFVDAPTPGSGMTGYKVRLRTLNGVTGIDCDARHACVLFVGQQLDDFSQPHVFIDIHWAATAIAAPIIPGASKSPPAQASSSAPIAAAATPAPATGAAVTSAPATSAASTTSASPAAATGTAPTIAGPDPGAASSAAILAPALAQTGLPEASAIIAALAVLAIVGATGLRRRLLRTRGELL